MAKTTNEVIEGKTPARAEVKGGITPYLVVKGAGEAAEFYKKALGAEEAFRYPPDDKGRYFHIHLYINGNSVMLSDAFEERGLTLKAPASFTLHLEVRDVDASWKRAVDAGAKPLMPPADMFWGARYGEIEDPFGVRWSMGKPNA